MFAKPYKLKSNNTLKNSEKKHLAQRIQDEFPSSTEEKVKEIMSVKSSCICMKLVLHSGDMVNVYSVDGVPMLIETAEGLIPTVCALWKLPDLIPVLAIHSPVLPKVQGGAPVYLPGVAIPSGGIGFPMFQRGSLIGLCTQENAAVCIIGRATMSSADMLLRAAGVCLETMQVFGDQLCKDNKFNKIERPKLGPAAYSSGDITINLTSQITQMSIQPPLREEWPSLGQRPPPTQAPLPPQNEPKVIAEELPEEEADKQDTDIDDSVLTEDSLTEQADIPNDMDGLLEWCLLSFLKLDAKRTELPLKTNLLYRNHLIPLCPPDRTLEVKKSSYKKLGKFLEAMQKEGLLEVREIDKGVDAVVAVNSLHPRVRTHRAESAPRAQSACAPPPRDYEPPAVREVYCVTAHVAELFAPLKKGTALTSAEVRTSLSEYVRTRALNTAHARAVTQDRVLSAITGKPLQEAVPWDVLMTAVLNKMTASTEMRRADGSVTLSKSRLQPVRMQLVTRSGNKKVTLVSNLEQFGFNLSALAHACQTGVAAACGVTREAGARHDQLMLQGDQTYFVAKLLIEKYGLPKKFVEGADKALNKKK